MARILVVGNQVGGFTPYGHLQFVFDADGVWDNGDEFEIEVNGPPFANGNWVVESIKAYSTPRFAGTHAVEVVSSGEDPFSVWQLLINARNFFATQAIDYQLGVFGTEGQNSNTYIETLAHIAGIDINGAVASIESQWFIADLPGVDRNVLFNHVNASGSPIASIALNLTGSSGSDEINGGTNGDTIRGAAGADDIYGLAGADLLYGDSGADWLFGGQGADRLFGGTGDDDLFGGADRDILSGEDGRDYLYGDDGEDDLFGGNQRDRLYGGAQDDVLDGGNGSDRLFAEDGDDSAYGRGGRDIAIGGAGSDLLDGGGGNDKLFGGADSDLLVGGTGDDQLIGQGGNDELSGGRGNDTMTGGGGSDDFIFLGKKDEGDDVITDFTQGRDVIAIYRSRLDFSDITVSGGADAIVTINGLTNVTLIGVSSSDVNASDFLFL